MISNWEIMNCFFAFIFGKIFISIVNIGHGTFFLWGVILVKAVMLGAQTKARELKNAGLFAIYGKQNMAKMK